ncbi:hypothetical protein PV328_010992 [Microctonus aethiopoides]|uniref:Serpin domain-containing protein n=1 Tax=Microctonus aethiopoides TaxID=144406 RepID=A0AA39KQS7_9HYME|nr:hypothetical protein PV328_010992 [Microctonus aethiopoides]
MATPTNMESLQSIVSSIDKFSPKFYKSLVKNGNNNLVCSPISVSMVLSMAAFGAYGETQKELRMGLNLLTTDEEIKRGIQSLTDTLNSIEASELQLANKMFTNTGFEVNPEFRNITETFFRSTTQSIDFRNTLTACQIINNWCEKQTNNRIRDVMKPSSISSDTRLILVNAVYFKGTWKTSFRKAHTQSKFFYINEQTKKLISMMHVTGNYNHAKVPNLNAHYIELPYNSNSSTDAISMFVILPIAISGLEEIEKNLEEINFKKLHENNYSIKINLQLPKFKITSINDMFTMNADFRRISESEQLNIDNVFQKAFLEVNEEGTVAAAVTTTQVMFGCARPLPPLEVVVNRPFFCAIVATNTGTQLFNARVIDPITI